MLKSMTAFGRARAVSSDGALDITAEIKSVNSRYLDCTVKISRIYGFLEDRVRQYVQSRGIQRGKLDVYVGVEVVENVGMTIEIDRALFPVLDETLASCDNVEVVQGDVLKVDLAALCAEKFGDKPVYACANLPYYITTPAITALLESGAFRAVTVMVQKEVAERICAVPGTADYSAFSIYVQYRAKAEILFDVPADCFVPQPKVDSAVIRLTPLDKPAVEVSDEKLFFSIVRAAFNQRRKTLSNAAVAAFNGKLDKSDVAALIESIGLDPRVRGERLSLEEYARLTDAAAAQMASKAE